MVIERPHFILYVKDQERSKAFYQEILEIQPALHVPGMTEFNLPGGAILGLMPEAGIKRLLGERLPDPSALSGVPRGEVYLVVDDASAYHARAISAGASEMSPPAPRDWGHTAAYSLDPDGHVLAFAEIPPGPPVGLEELSEADSAEVLKFTSEHWGADFVVAHGTIYHPARLSGFKAISGDKIVGLVTYLIQDGGCEIVTLNSTLGGHGVGSSLLEAVRVAASRASCGRIWLITTNDNHKALRFYQRRGYRLVKIHRGAVIQSRAMKPSIPEVGDHGIPIHDEIELELRLK